MIQSIIRPSIRALALLIAILAGAFVSTAQTTVKIGTLYYILDKSNHTATVTSDQTGENYRFVFTEEGCNIPEKVSHENEEYTVTSIGRQAFNKVSIMGGPLVIPNTVTTYEDEAFKKCNLYVGFIGSSNVTSIGNNAFESSFISEITIPRTVKVIPDNCFYLCLNLSKVTIEDGVTEIGNQAFGYSSIPSLDIPSSVTTIGEGAFSSSELTKIVIPGSVHSIPKDCFSMCHDLSKVTIEDGVTEIGANAFRSTSLPVITIPSSVTTIGEGAFQSSGLTSIVFPGSVHSISKDCFSMCRDLSKVTIEDGVTEIGANAFWDTSISTLTIPSSVTTIGESAFDSSGLTSISIPGSVKVIPKSCFASCENLSEVTLEDGVTEIGQSAFWRSSVAAVSIPSSVTTIGNIAFYGSGLTSVTVPGSVKVIPEGCFSGCKNLTEITVSEGVAEIGEQAFASCSSLTEIVLPESLVTLGFGSFLDCTKLAGFNIPSKVTTLPSCLLSGCSSMEALSVPATVTNIGGDCFPATIKTVTIHNPDLYDDYANYYDKMAHVFCKETDSDGNGIPRDVMVFVPKESLQGYRDVLDTGEFHVYAIGQLPENVKLGIEQPEKTSYYAGETLQLHYTVTPAGIPIEVKWTSSDETVASVSSEGLVTMHNGGLVTISVTPADAGEDNQIVATVNLRVLVPTESIDVRISGDYPDRKVLTPGETVILTAIGHPADALQDFTWNSSNPDAGTVEASENMTFIARFTAVACGKVTVTATATDGTDVSGSIELTVVPTVAGITVTAAQTRFEQGETVQLEASVEPEGAIAEVTWSSSDANVATVDEHGLVTGHGDGSVTITATATDGSGISGSIVLEVVPVVPATGIAIADKPESTTIAAGTKLTLSATTTPADATGKITWSTDNTDVLSVDAAGNITAIAPGTATVTVTITDKDGSTFSDNLSFTVIPAAESIIIGNSEVKDGKVTMLSGTTLALSATVTPADAIQNLDWLSSDTETATVAEGIITAIKPGKAIITAKTTDGSDISVTIEVTVTVATESIVITEPESRTVTVGETLRLTAESRPEDASTVFDWSSSDEAIATVSTDGTVTGVAEGTVTITVRSTDGTDKDASIQITVLPYVAVTAVIISPVEVSELNAGETLKLTATLEPSDATATVIWTSSDTEAATVDATGLVTALSKDADVEITASVTNRDGSVVISDPVKLTIKAFNPVLATAISLGNSTTVYTSPGERLSLAAALLPEDVTTKKVAWSFSDNDNIGGLTTGDLTATFHVKWPGIVNVTASTVDGSELSATVRIICFDATGINQIEADGTDDSSEVKAYNLTGTLVARTISELRSLAPGIYIVNGRKIMIR